VETLFAFRWYLVLQLFGIAALPLTLRLFRHVPGRGYVFARPLGLLLGGWVCWLLGIFGWLPNSAGSVVVSLALVAVWGTVLWLRSSEDDGGHSFSWRHVLAVELLFALAFAGWCVARSHMPRIEHAGGEKWMEIAFLNSVLRSPQFPPQDPWLAGFGISYYYFGYLIVGLLITGFLRELKKCMKPAVIWSAEMLYFHFRKRRLLPNIMMQFIIFSLKI